MPKILFLTYLISLLLLIPASSQACSDGFLPFNSTCLPIFYSRGCATYLPSSLCQVCSYGFRLLPSGACASNINQTRDCCASYGSDGSCLQCSNGLYWSDPYCLRNQIYGCIKTQNNLCAVCGQGFFQVKGSCLLTISNCTQYSSAGACIACAPAYTLTDSSFCVPQPQAVANCNYQNDYGCVQCNSGYYLTTARTCNAFQPGCLRYWQGKCLACLPSFYLSANGQCQIDGCGVYNANGCGQCLSGYSLNNGKCLINGCIKVVNNTCLQCADSLRLSLAGCIQEANYKCQSCASGYIFVSNACIPGITGCSQYTSNNLCAACTSPFKLTSSGQCQILGCQSYSSQGCAQCSAPFSLSNNICTINNCAQFDLQGCTTCSSGYLLANKQCYIQVANCINYTLASNGNPLCSACATQYYLLNGVCRPAARGCVYDVQGNCRCSGNFSLSPNGTCQIVGCSQYNWQTCLACAAPFVLNTQTQLCQIQYCAQYSWQGCATCQTGWIAVGGQCLQGDVNCASYNAQGACQSCQSGFVLDSSGRCCANISNCQQFTSDRLLCQKCQVGFQLISGYCFGMLPNCQTMGVSNNSRYCQCCKTNYHLENGQCIQNDANCLKYTASAQLSQICTQCNSGYFLSSTSACLPQLVGCVYNNNNCVSCRSPFLFDSSQNNCYIPGCQTYTNSGCQQCASPFTLNSTTCQINYCSQYNRTACINCVQGYQLTNSGLCAQIDKNCIQYSGTKCSQCKAGFGFAPTDGQCVILDAYCQSYSNGACTNCIQSYYLSVNSKCLPKQHGCIYQAGICRLCQPPFTYNSTSATCSISACLQTNNLGCTLCANPFVLASDLSCTITNCLKASTNGCLQCSPQFHLRNGACMPNSPSCLSYSSSGFCQLCAQAFTLSSTGDCTPVANSSCVTRCTSDPTKCLQCTKGYFLNPYYQCELKDGKCSQYTNGACSQCNDRYFLYSSICFPYTAGCVQYSGPNCTQCKVGYTLREGECFGWNQKKFTMGLADDKYDFAITPIDIRQSMYYINNLSPASAIGKFFFSSYYNTSYQDQSLSTLQGSTGNGWMAKSADQNQYIGILIANQPTTFFALQLQSVQNNYITQFYLQYSLNGTDFIRVQTPFNVPSSIAGKMATIYFTGIYALAIRIQITGYVGLPACRLDFFYYDLQRFQKITNLKSLTYLTQIINYNYVGRVDNQLYINQAYFFNPHASCKQQELCFTGLQLCQVRNITGMTLTFQDDNNYVTQFYLTYSVDGRTYNCYQGCQLFNVTGITNGSFSMKIQGLSAEGVRVFPKKYVGTPKFSPTFFYN